MKLIEWKERPVSKNKRHLVDTRHPVGISRVSASQQAAQPQRERNKRQAKSVSRRDIEFAKRKISLHLSRVRVIASCDAKDAAYTISKRLRHCSGRSVFIAFKEMINENAIEALYEQGCITGFHLAPPC